jgi:hypothetical protein
MRLISNRSRIVLCATIFNLSFEYSLRGFFGFFRPIFLPLLLFGLYFSLFSMLEDLIVRFRLRTYQLALASFLYGTFAMAFATGALFDRPQFLGIAWGSLFFVGVLWWGILQAVITFYFANRIVQRDWGHRRMGRFAWAAALAYSAAALATLKIANPNLAPVRPVAYLIFMLLAGSTALFLQRDLQRNQGRKPWRFEPSLTMDFLSFGTFILFVCLGSVFSGGQVLDPASASRINPSALAIVKIWTFGYSGIFILHRLQRGMEVTV